MTPSALKSAREALGLSQAEFARLLGLRGQHAGRTVRGWEIGEFATPGEVETLLWLLDRLPQARALLLERLSTQQTGASASPCRASPRRARAP
jgi:transcriptional regulator with XRE-family HTH domain